MSWRCHRDGRFSTMASMTDGVILRTDGKGRVVVTPDRRAALLEEFSKSGMAKRLEKGTFSWPEGEEKVIRLRSEALAMLTGGVDLRGAKMRPWYDRGD